MSLALTDVIKLRVLGMFDEATALLGQFLPGLRQVLADSGICSELRNPTELRPPSLIGHLETLSVGEWLKTGEYDLSTLARIIEEIDRDPDYKPKSLCPPMINQALLAAVEYGDGQIVERYYRKWEKRPLEDAPSDLRFCTNPRHILFANFRFGRSHAARTLEDGMNRMANRARDWNKLDAVPFIGLVELSRIVFVCDRLRGTQTELSGLWQRLK